MATTRQHSIYMIIAFVGTLTTVGNAAPPRILPDGQLPKDQRLEPLKDLNGYFPFQPARSPMEWRIRAERVRRQLLVSLGLWPMPMKTPLNAVVHGKIEHDDYTVEKAFFESFPGFYVTGNLYRPKEMKGKRPAVLCPHGHWSNGRFHDAGQAAANAQIKQGGEQLHEAARSPLQARCVHLARMGCVVFHYDMIGYADSTQISFQLAHRFGKQRPEMNTANNWGLFSPQSVANYQSVMGLQAYSSIRAIDFLTSLPDVDSKRIAVTGASGGGTQTFILSAIDPRVAVSMPAVMVSTAMQGGCTCENCSGLRVNTGNVEFAALFAPKPLALTAADDWTKEMKTKGFPQLVEHYKMLGAAENVMLHSRVEFKHNYNLPSRMALYRWFKKHLRLEGPVKERDFMRLTRDDMTVWNDEHPRPQGGVDFERKLLRRWRDDSNKQLADLTPSSAKTLNAFKQVYGNGIDIVVGRGLPKSADLEYDQSLKIDKGEYLLMGGMLNNKQHGEQLPIIFLYPKQWNGHVVVWLDKNGKAGLFDAEGKPRDEIRKLVAARAAVIGADLLFQGEFLAGGKPLRKTRRVENPREAAGYTLGYNHSLFARRVHDVLSLVAYVRSHDYMPEKVTVVGLNGAGPWVAAARAQARDAIDAAVVDTSGFRFGNLKDHHHVDFVPGGAKYGDILGMLAVSAPDRLWLAGESNENAKLVTAAYKAAGAQNKLTIFDGDAKSKLQAAVAWLLK